MAFMAGNNNKRLDTRTLIITAATDDDLSDAVDIGTAKVVGLVMPSGWTAANIQFQAAAPGSATFNQVIDATGAVVTVQNPSASKHIVLSPYGIEGIGKLKISTTAGQAANRTFTLILKDD